MTTSASSTIRLVSTDDLRALVDAFEAGTLPRSQWTHAAHLAVAVWYIVYYGAEDATSSFRTAVQAYNAAHGVTQTAHGGYHETLTRFYLWAVTRQIRQAPLDGSLADLANRVITVLGDQSLVMSYYSPERLMSLEARRQWVEPDLRPLA